MLIEYLNQILNKNEIKGKRYVELRLIRLYLPILNSDILALYFVKNTLLNNKRVLKEKIRLMIARYQRHRKKND